MYIKNFLRMGVLAITYACGSLVADAASLRNIVQKVVHRHPEVKALSYNKQAIEQELKAANGLGLPGVRLTGKKGWLKDDNTEQRYKEWSVVLKQPLFDGGKARSEINRQTNRVQSANSRVSDTLNTISLQAIQAFLEVRRSRIALKFAKQNLVSLSGVHKKVKARYSKGGATKSDFQQAQARLYAARNSEAEAQLRLIDSEDLYFLLVGLKPGKLKSNRLPYKYMPSSVNELIEIAKSNSPKILAMQHDAFAAKYAIGTARSVVLPKIDLELSVNYRDQIIGSSGENTTYKALSVFTFDAYNGGINHARIEEAAYRADEAQALSEAAVLVVEREIRVAWNGYHKSQQKVKLLKSQASANRATYKTREKEYDVGRATLISILDARNEYFTSRTMALNEEFSGKFDFYKLLAVSGKLTDVFGVDQ